MSERDDGPDALADAIRVHPEMVEKIVALLDGAQQRAIAREAERIRDRFRVTCAALDYLGQEQGRGVSAAAAAIAWEHMRSLHHDDPIFRRSLPEGKDLTERIAKVSR